MFPRQPLLILFTSKCSVYPLGTLKEDNDASIVQIDPLTLETLTQDRINRIEKPANDIHIAICKSSLHNRFAFLLRALGNFHGTPILTTILPNNAHLFDIDFCSVHFQRKRKVVCQEARSVIDLSSKHLAYTS